MHMATLNTTGRVSKMVGCAIGAQHGRLSASIQTPRAILESSDAVGFRTCMAALAAAWTVVEMASKPRSQPAQGRAHHECVCILEAWDLTPRRARIDIAQDGRGESCVQSAWMLQRAGWSGMRLRSAREPVVHANVAAASTSAAPECIPTPPSSHTSSVKRLQTQRDIVRFRSVVFHPSQPHALRFASRNSS